MAVSDHYLTRVLRCLAEVASVSCRPAFSGTLLLHKHLVFALVVGEALYFRTDAASAQLYQRHAMRPLQPRIADPGSSSFYRLPETILDQPDELRHWMRAAVEAAQESTPAPAARVTLAAQRCAV